MLETILIMNGIIIIITLMLKTAEKVLISYKKSRIIINNKREISVEGGSSLLYYLNSNGIYIPSGCGAKATCGLCKVRVLKGGDPVLPTEEPFLTRQEKLIGIRLACQVKVKREIAIEIPEHLFAAKELIGNTEAIYDLTHDIKGIDLILENPLDFKPGQFLQIKIPGSENEFRAYSIASSPSLKNRIQFIIKKIPGGLATTYIHDVLKVGDKINLVGPFGDFILTENSEKDLLLIAGGTGIAPILCILEYIREKKVKRRSIRFFYGVRSNKDFLYEEKLRVMETEIDNFHYIPAVSEVIESAHWTGEKGFITEVVDKRIGKTHDLEAYLCGSPTLIESAVAILLKKGMQEDSIHYDKF